MGKIGSPDYSAVVNKFLFHQNTLGVSPFPNISTFTFFFLPENVSKESCKECLQKAQKVASQNFIFYFNFCVFCFAFFTVVSLIPYFSRAAQMRLRITKLLLSAFFFCCCWCCCYLFGYLCRVEPMPKANAGCLIQFHF